MGVQDKLARRVHDEQQPVRDERCVCASGRSDLEMQRRRSFHDTPRLVFQPRPARPSRGSGACRGNLHVLVRRPRERAGFRGNSEFQQNRHGHVELDEQGGVCRDHRANTHSRRDPRRCAHEIHRRRSVWCEL